MTPCIQTITQYGPDIATILCAHQSIKLVVAKVWSIRELDTKLTALPPVGDEFSVKVQRVKEAVLLTSSASSGTKLSCSAYV